MATYKQIQNYIKRIDGITVKTCWIAHVKELKGLNPRKAQNRKSYSLRSNPCPDNKINFIENALKHFNMIQ